MRTQWGNSKPIPGSFQSIATAAATGFVIPKGTAPGEAPGTAGPAPASGPVFAVLSVEVADVRYRDDGTDPSAAVGVLLPVGTVMVYTGKINQLKFINAVPASGAKVSAAFYAS